MRSPPAAALAAVLAVLAAPTAAVRAEIAVECHCFKDRTWDPARPESADPYVLATTRSSLLSAAFGVGKGDVVRAVMGGTRPDDLWIAHWAGARAGRDPAALLAARERLGSWRAALAGASGLGLVFEGALARGAADGALSAIAIDDVLLGRLHANAEDVALLRAARASSEEVVLAAVLAARLRAPAMPLLARVRSGSASWGSTLHDVGLAPHDMDAVVRTLVR
ncbi:MAG TPA: hypothetical protein VF841_03965 [Anaeromyxobacter sp.]